MRFALYDADFYAEAAEVTMPIYRVELAKSNRSKCVMEKSNNCKFGECSPGTAKPAVIPKDSIRIGSVDPQSGAYVRWVGKIPQRPRATPSRARTRTRCSLSRLPASFGGFC